MSLYNKLFGVNPYATSLLLILGGPEVPRFGDCYLNEASEIVIFTRTGGNNREAYKAENAALTQVPGYLRDEDDGSAVAHALDVGRQILSKVEKAANGKGPHIIEV